MNDAAPALGLGGLCAALTLSEVNTVISIAVGLATLGYIVTKWVLLVRRQKRQAALRGQE